MFDVTQNVVVRFACENWASCNSYV